MRNVAAKEVLFSPTERILTCLRLRHHIFKKVSICAGNVVFSTKMEIYGSAALPYVTIIYPFTQNMTPTSQTASSTSHYQVLTNIPTPRFRLASPTCKLNSCSKARYCNFVLQLQKRNSLIFSYLQNTHA